MNGLDITEEEFCRMNAKDRDLIMYKNVVHVRQKLSSYRLHRKLQYYWLGILTAIGTALLGFKRYIPI